MSAIIEGNGMKLQQADENSDPNDLLLTGFTFPDKPDLTIPALVFKKTKDAVQKLALSSNPVDRPSSIPYNLTRSTTAGQGMFATEDITTGSLILTERPILVTRAEFPAESQLAIEPYLQVLFGRLTQPHQVLYSNLQNCKSPLEAGPLVGRLRTNGFTFSPYEGSPPHAGVFPNFARCNHSCGPNAQARFNYTTWAIELRATRSIQQGDEIFISYVDVLQPSIKRRAQLAAAYDFTCRCKWCTLPRAKLAESDARRADIAGWSQVKLQMGDGSAAPPDFLAWRNSDTFAKMHPSALIQSSLGKVVAATREGLESFMWMHVMTLYKVYALLGDEKNFRKWRTTFRDLILANLGVTPEFETANRQLDDPVNTVPDWDHWNLVAKATETAQAQ
ncbi:hypothetical protein M408DRAFT_14040 [Serendipita vermifera MAFF 305830]|uniref:SET domain-containing protein n=1 Tax=Serendipita vermifera MAFF 305830 TaxID=933852 RepID=A0A0C3B8R1_SERVB|nr:hypothetical protein M408DRAFT_14040 [Serendipita vermifera MAFF 305830]